MSLFESCNAAYGGHAFTKHLEVKSGFPAYSVRCNKKLNFLNQRLNLALQNTVAKGQSNIAVTSLVHLSVETTGENISL